MTSTSLDASDESNKPQLRIVGKGAHRLWGLTQEERLGRAFTRAGVRISDRSIPSSSVVLVRGDMELEPSLVTNLVARPDVALVIEGGDSGQPEIVAAHVKSDRAEDAAMLIETGRAPGKEMGLGLLKPQELASVYNPDLRKREPTYAFSLRTTPVTVVEDRTFAGSYKGVTDFVTKYIWPKPAKAVTRWAAEHGISPNAVTTASLILVLAAMWSFYYGHFLIGLPLAWLMTFLDTVDGKLARVTMTSSTWGNIYDHGIDLIHPPFWWWAWWVGLSSLAQPLSFPLLEQALYVILVGYVVGRLMEGIFNLFLGVQLFTWRPIDSHFRLITARRNPNLAILTLFTLAGAPDWGFVVVAAWTVISLAFHLVRLLQAVVARLSGKTLESWLVAGK